MIILYPEPGVF